MDMPGFLLAHLGPFALILARLGSSMDSELCFFETYGGLGGGFQNSDFMAQPQPLRGT